MIHISSGTIKSIFLGLFLLTLIPILPAQANEKETAFDRIIRTGVIRCGYYVFPPVIYRDPKTDTLSGFTVDLMNEIAKRASLKIEWTTEVTWANWIAELQTNRYDVACTPMWPDTPTARAAAFSIPLFYSGLYPVVRADDTRFVPNDLKQFNKKDIIFAAPEASSTASLAQAWFPQATLNIMPSGTDNGTYVLQLTTKKADAILWDDNGIYQFNKTHQEKVKPIAHSTPLKVQPFSIGVNRQEMVLKDFLDNAVLDLINDGTMERLLRKWEFEPGKTFLRAARPYKAP